MPNSKLEPSTKIKSFLPSRLTAHLVLDLVLLRVLERDVVLGQPRLPLPVLQQDEPDLRRRGRLNQGEEQEWVNERTVTMGWVFVTMAEDDVDASESGRTGARFGRRGRNEKDFWFLYSFRFPFQIR